MDNPIVDPRSIAFVVSAIQTTARIGTNQAFKAFAKSSPNSVTEAAIALDKSITETILPYLDGATVHASTEIKRLLASSLLAKIPQTIRDGISVASGILDAFLPIPAAATTLTKDQIDYIRAFVSGVGLGCDDFIPDPVTGQVRVERSAEPRWIEA